jgi:hypothetical protein
MMSDIIYATWFKVVPRVRYFAHRASFGSQNKQPQSAWTSISWIIFGVSCILREFETKSLGRIRSASPFQKIKTSQIFVTQELRIWGWNHRWWLTFPPPTTHNIRRCNADHHKKIQYTLTNSVLSSPPAPFSSFLFYLCLYSVSILKRSVFYLSSLHPQSFPSFRIPKLITERLRYHRFLVFKFTCSWLYYFCFVSGFLSTAIFLSVRYAVRRQ